MPIATASASMPARATSSALAGFTPVTFTSVDWKHFRIDVTYLKMNNYDHFHPEKRTMDFAALQFFKAVVDEGGITAAAKKLHRVQSNVTTRIKQLEESLGA